MAVHTILYTENDVVELRRTRDALSYTGIMEADRTNVQCTSRSLIAVSILVAMHVDIHAC